MYSIGHGAPRRVCTIADERFWSVDEACTFVERPSRRSARSKRPPESGLARRHARFLIARAAVDEITGGILFRTAGLAIGL